MKNEMEGVLVGVGDLQDAGRRSACPVSEKVKR